MGRVTLATCGLLLVILGVSSATSLGRVSEYLEALRSFKRSLKQEHARDTKSNNDHKRAHEEEFSANNNVAKRAHEIKLRGNNGVEKRAHEVEFGGDSNVAKRAHEMFFGMGNKFAKRAHKLELGGKIKFAKRAHEVKFGRDNGKTLRDQKRAKLGSSKRRESWPLNVNKRAHQVELQGNIRNAEYKKREQASANNRHSAWPGAWKVAKRAHGVEFGEGNGAVKRSDLSNNRETHSIKFREPATKREATSETCEVDGPIQMLNYRSGTYLNVFTDISVPCDGRIARWFYYAQGPGVFYASIWRPMASNRFELVGSNLITASAGGPGNFEVPFDDRIVVTEGMVLGIYYSAHIVNRASGGVIPYDDSRHPDIVNPQSLSPIHNSETFAEDLLAGTSVVEGVLTEELIGEDVRRQPAINFFVAHEEENPLMTLGYSAEPGDEMDEWVHATYITDPSQSASMPGQLVGWNLYVENVLPIALQIWRPKGGDRYQMISETWVHPSQPGAMHVDLGINCARCRQIMVKPGDTLGFYFPDEAVIPFTRYSPCNEHIAHRYYTAFDPSSGQRAEEGDAIEFEVAQQSWGACRKYAYSAEIRLDEAPSPSPTPGGGGGGGQSGCGVPQITPNVENRIVGGIPAIAHSWPWMVSLQSESGFHYCGGSLIANQWVATAAHCMPFSSSDKVVLGMHNKQHSSGVENHVNARHFTYPGYTSFNNDGDIALLKLDHPVEFQQEISPVCLPRQGENFRTGESGDLCYTTGWGDLESWGASPDTLMQVEVPLVETSTCNQADWYAGEVTENMVCAGYEEGGKDSCQGDSGGPLICHVDGQWKLTGIVSWGYGCAQAKKPGIYSKTSNFVDWVEETMRDN